MDAARRALASEKVLLVLDNIEMIEDLTMVLDISGDCGVLNWVISNIGVSMCI